MAVRFVNDRKPYVSFLFLQVACNCEKDIRATTSSNLRRQRTQERVCICFTNGLSTMRVRRVATNANVRLMWFYSTIKWFFFFFANNTAKQWAVFCLVVGRTTETRIGCCHVDNSCSVSFDGLIGKAQVWTSMVDSTHPLLDNSYFQYFNRNH